MRSQNRLSIGCPFVDLMEDLLDVLEFSLLEYVREGDDRRCLRRRDLEQGVLDSPELSAGLLHYEEVLTRFGERTHPHVLVQVDHGDTPLRCGLGCRTVPPPQGVHSVALKGAVDLEGRVVRLHHSHVVSFVVSTFGRSTTCSCFFLSRSTA